MMSSAGNTRGLIEAGAPREKGRLMAGSSAGNTRGLIEAYACCLNRASSSAVFRGEYPRPH